MDERDFEMSERKVALERDSQIGRATAAVTGRGSEDCVQCGYPIPAARRAAAPFAERCVECQEAKEKGSRR